MGVVVVRKGRNLGGLGAFCRACCVALLVNLKWENTISRDRDYRDYSQPIYYFIPFYTYLQALV